MPESGISNEALQALMKSEGGQNLLDLINFVVVAVDIDCRVKMVNKKGREVLGLKPGEAAGRSWVEEFVPPNNQERVRKILERVNGKVSAFPAQYENIIKTVDGELLISWRSTPLLGSNGNVEGAISIGTDIAENRELTEKLKESEAWLQDIYAKSPVGIEIFNDEGKLVDANRAALEMLGIAEPKDLKNYRLFEDPNIPAKAIEGIKGGKAVRYETLFDFKKVVEYNIYRTSKSGILYIDVNITPLYAGEALRGYLVHLQDITQRKMAETQISFQASLLDQVRNSVIAIGVDGLIVYWNRFSEALYQWAAEESIGRNLFDLIFPYTPAEVENRIFKKIEGDGYWESEFTVQRKDRKEIRVNIAFVAIRSVDGRLIGFVGVSSDISERKKMEEALRISERRYRGMLEDQTELIARFTADGRLTYTNSAYKRYFGEKSNFRDIYYNIPGENQSSADDILKSLSLSNPMGVSEHQVRLSDGTIRWMQWINRAIFNDEKQFVEYQSVGRDVTDRKEMERALQESEERYRGIVEDQTEFIAKWTPDGKIAYVNSAFARFFGKAPEEFVGKDMMALISDDDRSKMMEMLSTLTQEKPTGTIESRVVTSRGTRWTQWTSRAIFDSEGKLKANQTVGTDITDRKIMEEALRDSERRLADIIDFLPDPTLVIDADGKVLTWNHAIEKLSGVESSYMLGKTNSEYSNQFYNSSRPMIIDLVLKKNPDIEKTYPKIERVGDSIRAEGYVKLRDGRSIYTLGQASPLYDLNGNVIGAIETFKDITDRKQMEEELKQYSGQLEHLVEEKTKQLREAERLAAIGETATMVGHDLRNPLQAIVNSMFLTREIMKDMPESQEKTDVEAALIRIQKNIEYMNKIVSDVQDFARPFKPELIEVKALSLIEEILGTMKPPENVKVQIKIPENFKIVVDTLLIRRVFTNIITNAIQAMPNGGILAIKAAEDQKLSIITFQDTGVGISEENMKKLFQPLFTTKSKGQGMGLAVVKRIVEAHSGTISVKSETNKGTAFIINLPRKEP